MEDPISLSETEEYSLQDDSPKVTYKNQELLVMTVEIGDGRQDIITISENDDPNQLAYDFAQKHKLDKSLQQSLAQVIRQNKELVVKRANTSSPDIGKMSDYFGSYSSSYTQKDNFPFEDKKNHAPTINQRSKMLATKRQSHGSVYDRLYRQANKPSKSVLSNTTNQNSKSKSSANINYGEWLYVKGLKQKEAKLKRGETAKQENENKELDSYTFKPQINKFSNLLSPRHYEKTEDLLTRKAEEYKERLTDLKAQAAKEEMKECTFIPSIKETGAKTRTKSIHDELFAQAFKRKEKQMENEENSFKQYSFRPEIHVIKNEAESHEDFIERLVHSKEIIEGELQAMRKQQELTHDVSTGQRLFQPQTYKPQERHSDLPVWDYLYSLKEVKQKNIADQEAQTQSFWDATAAATKASEKSQKIFEEFRRKQYKKLFDVLDSDNDGLISEHLVNIDQLDSKNLSILTPLFKKLEESKESMDFKEFVVVLEEICKNLGVEEKSHLLKRENKVEISQEISPRISLKSEKLAEKSRGSLPEDFYERSMLATKLNQMKISKEKELKELDELKHCTFRPSLK